MSRGRRRHQLDHRLVACWLAVGRRPGCRRATRRRAAVDELERGQLPPARAHTLGWKPQSQVGQVLEEVGILGRRSSSARRIEGLGVGELAVDHPSCRRRRPDVLGHTTPCPFAAPRRQPVEGLACTRSPLSSRSRARRAQASPNQRFPARRSAPGRMPPARHVRRPARRRRAVHRAARWSRACAAWAPTSTRRAWADPGRARPSPIASSRARRLPMAVRVLLVQNSADGEAVVSLGRLLDPRRRGVEVALVGHKPRRRFDDSTGHPLRSGLLRGPLAIGAP